MVWCQFNLDSLPLSVGFDMKVYTSQELQCGISAVIADPDIVDRDGFHCGIIGNKACRDTLINCGLLVGECNEGQNNDTHHCYSFSPTFNGTVCCELQGEHKPACRDISPLQVPTGK